MSSRRAALFACLAVLVLPAAGGAATAPAPRKPDLADEAQGVYHGDVISDARGSSRSDVAITVTRIGPNRVRVTADYDRLPPHEVALTRALQTIQAASGSTVFLLDLSKHPLALSITVDDASWAGAKE